MKLLVSAFASGLLFAIGLAIAGMTVPANVIAFLNVTGQWNPALAFVMVGGISVYSLSYWISIRMGATPNAALPRAIDARLVGGSVLFGIGWGVAGFCPGPALVAAASGSLHAVVFVAAMVSAFWATRRADAHFRRRTASAPDNG